MKTKVEVEKTDYPAPATVANTMARLQNVKAPMPRDRNTISMAMQHLEEYRQLLIHIYTSELNDSSLDAAVLEASDDPEVHL